MKDNTFKDYNGNSLDIYEDNIFSLADDYINTVLNKPEDIARKQCFGGMIKYISTHIDKLDINNLVLLDRLWSIYTTLCYKYNHVVTVERYCIIKISEPTGRTDKLKNLFVRFVALLGCYTSNKSA